MEYGGGHALYGTSGGASNACAHRSILPNAQAAPLAPHSGLRNCGGDTLVRFTPIFSTFYMKGWRL